MCEKLTIFPNLQYIVGIYVSLAFWWYSQVQDRSGGGGENTQLTRAKWPFLQHGVHALPLMTPLSWPTLILSVRHQNAQNTQGCNFHPKSGGTNFPPLPSLTYTWRSRVRILCVNFEYWHNLSCAVSTSSFRSDSSVGHRRLRTLWWRKAFNCRVSVADVLFSC